jgi:hypothetical protein
MIELLILAQLNFSGSVSAAAIAAGLGGFVTEAEAQSALDNVLVPNGWASSDGQGNYTITPSGQSYLAMTSESADLPAAEASIIEASFQTGGVSDAFLTSLRGTGYSSANARRLRAFAVASAVRMAVKTGNSSILNFIAEDIRGLNALAAAL